MLTDDVQRAIGECLEAVRARIALRMQEEGRNASGRTVSSMQTVVGGFSGQLTGSSSFLALQRGRSGGRVPYGFFDIIRQWIIDKGIAVSTVEVKRQGKYDAQERAIRSAAGAIAYTIMKSGTSLYRRHGYDDIYDTAIEEEVDRLRLSLPSLFTAEIQTLNQTLDK